MDHKKRIEALDPPPLTAARAARLQRGLTLAQAAVLAGLDPADLSRIETRRFIPYRRQAERVARLLGLQPEKLQEIVDKSGGAE